MAPIHENIRSPRCRCEVDVPPRLPAARYSRDRVTRMESGIVIICEIVRYSVFLMTRRPTSPSFVGTGGSADAEIDSVGGPCIELTTVSRRPARVYDSARRCVGVRRRRSSSPNTGHAVRGYRSPDPHRLEQTRELFESAGRRRASRQRDSRKVSGALRADQWTTNDARASSQASESCAGVQPACAAMRSSPATSSRLRSRCSA